MDKEIKRIIARYFDGELSCGEAEKLVQWVEDGNFDAFNEYVMVNYTLEEIEALRQGPNTDSWQRIAKTIRKEKKKKVPKGMFGRPYWKYVAAAAIAIIASALVLYLKEEAPKGSADPVDEQISVLPGTDKATLTLEDGTQVALGKGERFRTDDLKSEGESIVYAQSAAQGRKTVYNYLTIPRGGQFFLKLADGTRVWLNSESKLKYPVTFPKGGDREVELVYGEAYFEVSHGPGQDDGTSFKVRTKTQNLEVLGTEFNVRAYKGKERIYTTLIKGRVTVGNGIRSLTLVPSERSVLHISDEKLYARHVDVAEEVAWRHGYFLFDRMPLAEIMERLSRWYDFEPRFEDSSKKKITFSGRLDRSGDINELLGYIQETGMVGFTNKDGVLSIK